MERSVRFMKKAFALLVMFGVGHVALAQDSFYRMKTSNTKGCEPIVANFAIPDIEEEIVWEFSNGEIAVGNNVEMNFAEAGVYSVKATFTENGKEVVVERTKIIEVYPKPQPMFEVVDDPIIGSSLYSMPTIGSKYNWYLETGEKLDYTSYQIPMNDLEPGVYKMVLEETNSLGCAKRTDAQSIEVLASR